MNTGAMSAAQAGKGAMRAGLAAPDASVVHARQIVEHERGRMRELHAAGRWQDELQGIVAKDLAGSDGHKSAPAMSAAERGIAGGVGDLGCGSLRKDLLQKILDRAPDIRLGGVEVHGCPCP